MRGTLRPGAHGWQAACYPEPCGAGRRDVVREPDMPAAPGRAVLIIDDHAEGRDALRAFLELCGHRVEVAENGEEGIARALATRPEVAFIDIGLPDLDGYTVARRLREALDGRRPVLVAL